MTTLWRRNRFLKVTIWRLPFGGTFWLAGLAGRRFLVLIIKVTLSELSEASAPSMYELYNESDNDANEILDTVQNLQYDVVKVFMPAADVDASRDGRLREVRPWPFT